MSLTFVEGDTGPPVNGTIVLTGTTTPVDLTGATVKFQMRKENDRRYQVDGAASLVTPSLGTVTYTWAANDLANPGTYLAQWEITFAGGVKQTTDPPVEIIVRRQ